MERIAADYGVLVTFDPQLWTPVPGFDFTDITYHRAVDAPVVRVAFDRPEVRNAFRPHTVDELYRALDHARMSSDVGAVLLTGNGPSAKDGGWAFCSGGDQRIRGRAGYQYADGESAETRRSGRAGPAAHPGGAAADPVHAQGGDRPGQRLGGRRRAQPARGLRPDPGQPRARPVQADRRRRRARSTPGFGSAYLARQVGQKFAREIFFLGDTYDAEDAYRMGMVNRVVPHDRAGEGRSGVGREDLRARARPRSGCSSSRSTPSTTG